MVSVLQGGGVSFHGPEVPLRDWQALRSCILAAGPT